MLSARVRLALLWVSQVTRVLADWGLRITAFLEVRSWGGAWLDSAWHLITALFIAPFILLAPLHGSISNSLPRRWVLVAASLVCLLAVAGLVPSNGPWLASMVLLAVGSALYSPTRYAQLPAASRDTHWPLNSVNGWMEMGSAAAIVGGIILGLQLTGTLSWAWGGELPRVIAMILALNLACLLTALPAYFPSDLSRPESPVRALRGFFRDARRIFADSEARGSLLGLGTFQAIVVAGTGTIFTLAMNSELSGRTEGMLALVMVCAGTALGCVLAALQTNPRRMLGLVPIGMTGLWLAEVWTALTNEGGITPAAPSFLLGLTGGLVNVPLRSSYLAAVPADARGNAMSVMNTVIYLLTSSVALVLFGLSRSGLLENVEQQLWFLVVVVGLGALLAWRLLLAQALEQMLEWLLWPLYRIRAFGPGVRDLPARGPLLLIANHSSYFDPFWLAKILPRRLTPMMTSKFFDLPLMRWLMVNIVQAIRVQEASFRREAPELQEAIEVLRRGGCVLVFPEAILRRKEERMLRQFGRGVWHILQALPQTPVVVFWIEGGWGSYASYRNGPPMKNKGLDWWRSIRIAVTEPEVLDPALLADHRTTRRYLMRKCLEARRYLGLEVPAEALAEIASDQAEPVEEGEQA